MRSFGRLCGLAIIISTAATTVATTANAQSVLPTAQAQDEARSRFQRALELADDGQFDAALVELRRAYELAPTYRILYNVGIVYQQLKDYARALDAYERYLDEGGAGVPQERLTDVNSRIERLKGRVGFLDVRTSEPNAEVLVDDFAVGTTPLKPVRVNSGQRKVTVRLAGRPAQSQIIELAGGETKAATFDLHLVTTAAAPPPEPKSIVPYVSWGVTIALAGGALGTGLVALNKADKYDQLEGQFGVDADTLAHAKDQAKTFALVTDILAGAAIVGTGVSIYFTVKPPKGGKEKLPSAQVGLYTNGTVSGLKYRF